MIDRMKKCSICGIEKHLDEFHHQIKSKDGRHSQCKPCSKERRTRTRDAKKSREQSKAWREKNPERFKAYAKAYYEKHGSKHTLAWNKRNLERVAAYKKEYRKAGKQREATARYRAKKLDQLLEDVKLDDLLVRDSGICGVCGLPLTEETIHIDHIVPVSKGGMHSLDNTQPVHRRCNLKKSNRDFYKIVYIAGFECEIIERGGRGWVRYPDELKMSLEGFQLHIEIPGAITHLPSPKPQGFRGQ